MRTHAIDVSHVVAVLDHDVRRGLAEVSVDVVTDGLPDTVAWIHAALVVAQVAVRLATRDSVLGRHHDPHDVPRPKMGLVALVVGGAGEIPSNGKAAPALCVCVDVSDPAIPHVVAHQGTGAERATDVERTAIKYVVARVNQTLAATLDTVIGANVVPHAVENLAVAVASLTRCFAGLRCDEIRSSITAVDTERHLCAEGR